MYQVFALFVAVALGMVGNFLYSQAHHSSVITHHSTKLLYDLSFTVTSIRRAANSQHIGYIPWIR